MAVPSRLITALALLVACGPKPAPNSGGATAAPASTAADGNPKAGAASASSAADGAASGTSGGAAAGGAEVVAEVPAGKFRIDLFRPAVVGEKARLTRTVTDLTQQRIMKDGKLVKNESMRQHVELDAVAETLAVTADERPLRTRYTVKRFEARIGQGMTPMLPPGAVLTVKRGSDAEQSVTSSTGALDKQQMAAIKLVISLRESRAGDQEIFGTTAPRAIGDSWPIDGARGKQSLEEEGIATLRSMSGNTTLVGRREVGGLDCLEILGRMEADIAHLPGLPADTKVVRGKLRARLTGLFPIDEKALPPLKSTSMTFDVVTRTTSPQGVVELHLQTQRDGEARLQALR